MKLSHAKASYRENGAPNRHCSICTMYRSVNRNGDHHCTLVEDPIEPYAVCKHFESKQ